MELEELRPIVEALLLVSGNGLTEVEIAKDLQEDVDEVRMVLDSLADDYLERDGGILIKKIKGKYQFVTHHSIHEMLKNFTQAKKKETLSKAMIETLAIITYKQPLTVFDIEEIRLVNSRSIVTTLISRGLVKSMGQKEGPGRPTLYGTTKELLEYLGINSLDELPPPQDIKELNFEEI